MKKDDTAVKEKKPRRIGRKILKILGILLLVLAVLVAILSVRHHILTKRDKAAYANAYGDFYRSPSGDQMNYTILDNGASQKTAVILPGYGCPTVRYEFDAFIKALEDQYRFIIVEPLGYGLSDETDTERTVDNYCDELHNLLDYLDCIHYTLIVHSIGGLYALNYANQYPDEVDAVIGIDASVPHQIDADTWIADPEHIYTLYKIMRPLLYGSGINRLVSELSFEQTAAQIPTLSGADKEAARALYCASGISDTQLNEMELLGLNMHKCYDMKFPEQVPVLYVLSADNCGTLPQWEQWHKDLVTNPKSKVTVIEGSHYLHFTSLQKLTEEIKNWIQ